MRFLSSAALSLVILAGLVQPALGDEFVDLEMITRIRDEAFNRSQVMETVGYLTETIGPRITGSPAHRRAAEWALTQLESWGLQNGELEPVEFGRGWSFEHCSVRTVSPRSYTLRALPQAWTRGTDGVLRGRAMRLDVETPEDLEEHRGSLTGKILFLDEAKEIDPENWINKTPFNRHDDEDLAESVEYDIPDGKPSEWLETFGKWWKLRMALHAMAVEEGAIALVEVSSRDNGLVRVTRGGSQNPDAGETVPALSMATENYNWVLRQLEDDVEVELEIDIDAAFHGDDLNSYNAIAEIPGGKKRDEVVIAGAHLDSWHAGTGATDNASGCAVVMEAVRILQELGLKPLRTIRVGLWTGEEQGYYGSRAHVARHFATRPAVTDPEQMKLPPGLRDVTWPIMPKPAHANFAAYFNLDNGAGKIRGIHAENNVAVAPIFEAWLKPFHDLGAVEVTLNPTGGTDHVPFDRVGLPGFQFMQDPLDYWPRTHHTNLDVYDHLQPDDLKQASAVMASFLYHAAMRAEKLPREAIPREPPAQPEKDEEIATSSH